MTGCRQLAWAQSPFCFGHLISHVGKSLSDTQRDELKERISILLKTISYIEREILKLRYMSLNEDGYTYTQQEVGRIFKRSASYVSRKEKSALRRLSHPVRFRKLQDFIEVYSFDKPNSEFVRIIQLCDQEILRYLAKHPIDVHRLPPDTFEQIIAEIMDSFGFEIELTQQTRDGGRDIIAVGKDSLGIRTSYIVECKRYAPTNPVRVELVRSLYGVKQQHQADHAILATTSYFTQDAIKFSESPTIWNLHLKGFDEITEWIRTYDKMIQKGSFLL
jgi:HJR/Mrr/RecB family endonuclease